MKRKNVNEHLFVLSSFIVFSVLRVRSHISCREYSMSDTQNEKISISVQLKHFIIYDLEYFVLFQLHRDFHEYLPT